VAIGQARREERCHSASLERRNAAGVRQAATRRAAGSGDDDSTWPDTAL